MTKAVFRACNGCRFRKVRCNGSRPCAQCAHLNLPCVFTPAPVQRRRSARGWLVSQLRGNSKGNISSNTARSHDSSVPSKTTIAEPSAPVHCSIEPDEVPTAPNATFSPDFFNGLLSEFEQFVYPASPIVSPGEIQASIANMHDDNEDAALAYAFASLTTTLVRVSGTLHDVADAQTADIVQQSLRAHRRADMHDMCSGKLGEHRASIKRIVTCIFLEMSMLTTKHFDRSFIILREAVAMIQILQIHQPTILETARFQRLYWEAYIHERYLRVVTGYPCILPPLVTGLPSADPSLPLSIHVGFNRLIRLFLLLDGPLLDTWIAQQNPVQVNAPRISVEWIESRQVQLDEDELGAAEVERQLEVSDHGSLTEAQRVDLLVTRLWMRTLVWQLALAHGLLCSTPSHDTHEGLSLHFPAQRLSAQLHSLVSRLRSFSSVAMHGSGIIQKLFDITSTIADVLALPPGQGQAREGLRPQVENFVFLAKFFLNFKRVGEDQKRYIREKLAALQGRYTDVDFGVLI